MSNSRRKKSETNSDKDSPNAADQKHQELVSIHDLPNDVLIIIFSQFDLRTLGALLLTDKYLSRFLTSQASNFIWEQQIANHFPTRYQNFNQKNQLSKTTYQIFKEYYKEDGAYQGLTREEKLVFSYLKDENISALEKYNSVSSSTSKNLTSKRTHIRVDQIPFHFLEWVAEYASQDFKDYLYDNVYKEVIESDEISNYFKFFPKIIASQFFWTDKARAEMDILTRYNQDVAMAYYILKIITSLFLGKSLKPILMDSVWRQGDPFDIVWGQESEYCNRKFWSEYVDKKCLSYFKNSSSYLGHYCLASDITELNQIGLSGMTLFYYPLSIVERGNEAVLKALNEKFSAKVFSFAVSGKNDRVLKILFEGDRNAKIKNRWSGDKLLDLIHLFTRITPECFEILSQHLNGFFKFDPQKPTQDQLENLSSFFEEAIFGGNIKMTEFFLEKYSARFRVGLEESNIHEFCMSKDVIWRRYNGKNGNKIFTLELLEEHRSRRGINYFPPKVKFKPLKKGSQPLPNPMINFFMVCALGEWYQYQWYEHGQYNPKLAAIQELILHVFKKQDKDFRELVGEWKMMTNPAMGVKTNLEIIRLQGAFASEAKDMAVDQLLLPAIGFFSHSAAEWVANQPKTATEKFIQELLDGAALYAKPKVEEVLKDDSDPEKSSTKKM